MKLARLLDMSFEEVAGRLRQEAHKRRERAGAHDGPFGCALDGDATRRAWLRLVAGIPAGGFAAERNEPALGSFFEGVEDEALAELVENFPVTCSDLVEEACQIQRGSVDLLGRKGLHLGSPVDWWRDPVRGTRFPAVHWSRIDPLDTSCGDVKLVWEVNRHQWVVRLAQAWRLTGEEGFAALALQHIEHWLRTNPYGVGVNWASSLEVALRLISWCWTLALLQNTQVLSSERLSRILAGLANHAAHIERYLSRWSSPNTHLTGEALGLFYAGTLLPELPEAARWRALGAGILVDQLDRQVLADGVYFEQSTWYQRYTADIYHHFLILAARNDVWTSWTAGERLTRLVDFLVSVRRPDGSMPQIGDGDGGLLLPIHPRGPNDFGGTFTVAAMLFGREDYAWAAGRPGPEALWLGGRAGWEQLATLRATPPPRPASQLYRSGGYAILRSGWDALGHQLILDSGPLGCAVSGAHGHADLLSFECSAYGEPYIVDPGTYLYGEQDWRRHFRTSEAHSTVLVDGCSQAEPAGPFGWTWRPPAPTVRAWRSDEREDYVEVEHAASVALSPPVVHRRRILFLKPAWWLIVDDLAGVGAHDVAVRFQFAPLHVHRTGNGWIRARGRKHGCLLLRSFAGVPLDVRIAEGSQRPRLGWYSPHYGRRVAAPLVIVAARDELPLRVATLLVPGDAADALPPRVLPLSGADGAIGGLLFEAGPRIVIDDQSLRIERDCASARGGTAP